MPLTARDLRAPGMSRKSITRLVQALNTTEDDAVSTDALQDEAVTPTKQAFGVRSVSQAAVAIEADDEVIHLTTTGAGGPFAITNGSMIEGKVYWLNMIARNTANYTMANVDGASTLTFDLAGERAGIYWDGAALRTMFLNGATLV